MVFGAADFAGGYATRRTPVATVTLITNVVGVVLAVGLVLALGGAWTTPSMAWGAAAGACGLSGLVLLYLGLAQGPNGLVSPLSAVVAAAIPVVVGIAGGDRPDRWAVAGLLVTPLAIWLVAAGGGGSRSSALARPLVLALGAGIGFGLFFTCLAQTPDDAGAVPLLAARATSTTVLLLAATRRRAGPVPRSALALPVLAGTLDMTANGLFLWSAREGDLAVVGALVSLFPVTTVLLAVLLLGERLSRAQVTGMVLAVGAAALLS